MILPSRLRAGSEAGSLATTGWVIATLDVNGMKASSCVHCDSDASAVRRERRLNFRLTPSEPVTDWLSGGRASRPKAAPPIDPAPGAV